MNNSVILIFSAILMVFVSGCITETGEVTGKLDGIVHEDPCAGVACQNSSKICPDGFEVGCSNVCNATTGECSSCEPGCAGHEKCVELWECAEWSDCKNGGQTRDCVDLNSCGTTINKPLEGKECVEEQEIDVTVVEIHYETPEWVEILNNGDSPVDMTNWTLKDNTTVHIYHFPSGFVLKPKNSVRVHTESGMDSKTDLYWDLKSSVWNNDGDVATLMNRNNDIVHIYFYTKEPADPCVNITCSSSTKICPDGVEVSCENVCTEGECSSCVPDCSGHECNLTCGVCEQLDSVNCVCNAITPCDGNGICETGEYPSSPDCPSCDDGDNCTDDYYNYTLQECEHANITPCCGNMECETGENQTSCPGDCEEQWGNYYDVIINEIMYNPSTNQCSDYDCEWIELYNRGVYKVNLSGWTLDEKTFEAEIINGGEYAVIARELIDGDDADTESFEYYWGDNTTSWGDSEIENYSAYDGSMILSNKNDTIVLKHSNGTVVDSVIYLDGWGADGNNKTLERYENGTWAESLINGGTPGLQNSV